MAGMFSDDKNCTIQNQCVNFQDECEYEIYFMPVKTEVLQCICCTMTEQTNSKTWFHNCTKLPISNVNCVCNNCHLVTTQLYETCYNMLLELL